MDAKEARRLVYEYNTRMNFVPGFFKDMRYTLNLQIKNAATLGHTYIRLDFGSLILDTLTSAPSEYFSELGVLNDAERDNYRKKLLDELLNDGYNIRENHSGTFVEWGDL